MPLPNKNKNVLTNQSTSLVIVWCLFVGLLFCLLLWRIDSGLTIEANILSLLDDKKESANPVDIAIAHSTTLDHTILFLVGDQDQNKATLAADTLMATLQKSRLFESADSQTKADPMQLQDLLFPYRYQLLDQETIKQLQSPQGFAHFLQDSQRMIYEPLGNLSQHSLDKDPLLISSRLFRSFASLGGNFTLSNGRVSTTHNGKSYLVISLEVRGNPFVPEVQQQVLATINDSIAVAKEQLSNGEILYSGMLRFAADSARRLEREGTLIGIGSFLAAVLLLALSFRSLRQVCLSALSIAVGLLTAVTGSALIFPYLHLIALAFGASLVGICIDYSLHYFAHHRLAGKNWDSREGLRAILPSITIGALTSIVAFGGLAFADFPGLRQIAVFSSFGLLGAFATVICTYPIFLRAPCQNAQPYLMKTSSAIINFWNEERYHRLRLMFFGCFSFVAVLGLLKIGADDDIRLLQDVSEELINNQIKISQIVGNYDHGRYFVVSAKSEQELLERQEEFGTALDDLVATGKLSGYFSLANLIPSVSKQERSWQLLNRSYQEHAQTLNDFVTKLGYSAKAIKNLKKSLTEKPNEFLGPETWRKVFRQSPSLQQVDLQEVAGGYLALMLIKAVKDEEGLKDLADQHSAVSYVNVVHEINSMLSGFRLQATWLAVFSYLAIFLFLLARYGLKQGLLIMTPPLLAALSALGLLGLFAVKLNLFHILALVLVLGIGIDYPIFFAEKAGKASATMFGVLLCAGTTVCSFGLMVASRTPVLHSFGFVLVVGVIAGVIFSPLAAVHKSN